MLKNQQISPGQPLCGLGIFPEILSDFREAYVSSLVNVKELILPRSVPLPCQEGFRPLLCWAQRLFDIAALVHEIHIPSVASFTDSAHFSILREYMGLILLSQGILGWHR